MKLYLGLLHHPVLNKEGKQVTTSVTNLDLHDIARSCRTYGVSRYFVITPLTKQKQLIARILGFWESNDGLIYNPDRKDALALIALINSLEETLAAIEQETGKKPYLVVTGANFTQSDGDEAHLLQAVDERPILLLFGTGWGLPASITENADFKLAPLVGKALDGYNHLSVRSAVSIYLDRLAR